MFGDLDVLHAHSGYRAAVERLGYCPFEANDAANECRHGRLPGDKSPSCGCFPEEGAMIVQMPKRPSRYRGVWRSKDSWRAEVVVGGVRHYLGSFRSEDEAGAAAEAFRNGSVAA